MKFKKYAVIGSACFALMGANTSHAAPAGTSASTPVTALIASLATPLLAIPVGSGKTAGGLSIATFGLTGLPIVGAIGNVSFNEGLLILQDVGLLQTLPGVGLLELQKVNLNPFQP